MTETGGGVSDAQVVATLRSTNQVRRTTTNSAGFYFLGGPPRACTKSRSEVATQTRSSALDRPNSGLEPPTSEALTQLSSVEVDPTQLALTPHFRSRNEYSRTQINNLPTFERNILDLAKLAPGISAQAVDNRDKFLASGQPARQRLC